VTRFSRLNSLLAERDAVGASQVPLRSRNTAIVSAAQFPPQIKTIDDALGAIDVAYHMNHRINGKVLFDPQTGKTAEGIGHYVFEKKWVTGEQKWYVRIPTPGILIGVLSKAWRGSSNRQDLWCR
jgi:hypothetical protein